MELVEPIRTKLSLLCSPGLSSHYHNTSESIQKLRCEIQSEASCITFLKGEGINTVTGVQYSSCILVCFLFFLWGARNFYCCLY